MDFMPTFDGPDKTQPDRPTEDEDPTVLDGQDDRQDKADLSEPDADKKKK